MAKRYFTLVSALPGQPWCIEFGDYSRAVVKQEMRDMRESGSWQPCKLKIIVSGDTQTEIETAVAALPPRAC